MSENINNSLFSELSERKRTRKKYIHTKPKNTRSFLCRWDMSLRGLRRKSLVNICLDIMNDSGLLELNSIPPDKFKTFLKAVSNKYTSLPYHNFEHATYVLHTCYMFFMTTNMCFFIEPLDILALFIAAICHDVEHDGLYVSRGYDPGTMELHHMKVTDEILCHKNTNIFAHFEKEQRNKIKSVISELILSTNINYHDVIIQDFTKIYKNLHNIKSDSTYTQTYLNFLLHCADLSNPVRPREESKRMALAIFYEESIDYSNSSRSQESFDIGSSTKSEEGSSVKKWEEVAKEVVGGYASYKHFREQFICSSISESGLPSATPPRVMSLKETFSEENYWSTKKEEKKVHRNVKIREKVIVSDDDDSTNSSGKKEIAKSSNVRPPLFETFRDHPHIKAPIFCNISSSSDDGGRRVPSKQSCTSKTSGSVDTVNSIFSPVDDTDRITVSSCEVKFIDHVVEPLWRLLVTMFPSLKPQYNEILLNRGYYLQEL